MKKQAEARDDNKITIIPEYGRQRLLTYAESFRDLADLFEGEDVEFTGKDEADPADRQDYLWQRRLQENQEGDGAYHGGGGAGDMPLPAHGRTQI